MVARDNFVVQKKILGQYLFSVLFPSNLRSKEEV